MAEAKERVEMRKQIRESLQDRLSEERLNVLMDEVLAMKKQVRIFCKHCNKHNWTEISDTKGVVEMIEKLLNQGFGRAGEIREEQKRLVVNRHVYVVKEDENDG